jgi:hypothetical protein
MIEVKIYLNLDILKINLIRKIVRKKYKKL